MCDEFSAKVKVDESLLYGVIILLCEVFVRRNFRRTNYTRSRENVTGISLCKI